MCLYLTVPLVCGVLLMVSEINKLKKEVLRLEFVEVKQIKFLDDDDDDDDGVEHYKDAPVSMI